jgi:AcrR family transcriptional regulator
LAGKAAIETGDSAQTLSTQDWIDVAKATLIREGVNAVKIDRMARDCGVTRGGFYWRFKSRSELLDMLLDDWVRTNTAPILAALDSLGSPADRFQRLAELWIDERDFSPNYDTAVRNWSKNDAKVAIVVRQIDDQRIDALKSLFRDYGYGVDEALVRARITYYHQVGYYAMELHEEASRRSVLSNLYVQVLTGVQPIPLLIDK